MRGQGKGRSVLCRDKISSPKGGPRFFGTGKCREGRETRAERVFAPGRDIPLQRTGGISLLFLRVRKSETWERARREKERGVGKRGVRKSEVWERARREKEKGVGKRKTLGKDKARRKGRRERRIILPGHESSRKQISRLAYGSARQGNAGKIRRGKFPAMERGVSGRPKKSAAGQEGKRAREAQKDCGRAHVFCNWAALFHAVQGKFGVPLSTRQSGGGSESGVCHFGHHKRRAASCV